MHTTTRRWPTAVALLLVAGALTACRTTTPTTDQAGVMTDFGVTESPCPNTANKAHGCIYLGIISDLTEGPFRALAVPVTDAQKAFWDRVNKSGGIGGYDIDVTTYVRDNRYNPQIHNEVYQEIKPHILALAQTLGSSQTAAILPDMRASNVIGAPAAWTSAFAFEDVILESGTNNCLEGMNIVDYAKAKYGASSVVSVHFAGDYGADAAAGVKIAAEKLGMSFERVQTGAGADGQSAAIAAIIRTNPSVVVISTGPTETAAIVGGAVAQGFKGRFIGNTPTWNPALLKSPAANALLSQFEHAATWGAWGSDTPGHKAMREALPNLSTLNDGYTYGWVWSYPIKAALEKAAANKDLTRAGLFAAAKSLTSVDYEGMLPAESGNFAAGTDGVSRASQINKPDPNAATGTIVVQPLKAGPTASGYKLTGACFNTL